MRITREAESKTTNYIFTKNLTLGQFLVYTCANQLRAFSICETSTPNGPFQIFNGLKRLVTYSKRLQ